MSLNFITVKGYQYHSDFLRIKYIKQDENMKMDSMLCHMNYGLNDFDFYGDGRVIKAKETLSAMYMADQIIVYYLWTNEHIEIPLIRIHLS